MATPVKRGPRKRLDEDGACPDCGHRGGHDDAPTGLPRCPENWTGLHLERVEARAQRAWDRYEWGADDAQPERTDRLYSEFRTRAEDAEWVHQVIYSGRGHSFYYGL